MTWDEVMRMAREVDIDWHKLWNDDETNRLERFAALAFEAGAAAEREACAKVCEEIGRGHNSAIAEFDCAAAIRERSKE